LDDLLRHASDLLDIIDVDLANVDRVAHAELFAAAPVLRRKLQQYVTDCGVASRTDALARRIDPCRPFSVLRATALTLRFATIRRSVVIREQTRQG